MIAQRYLRGATRKDLWAIGFASTGIVIGIFSHFITSLPVLLFAIGLGCASFYIQFTQKTFVLKALESSKTAHLVTDMKGRVWWRNGRAKHYFKKGDNPAKLLKSDIRNLQPHVRYLMKSGDHVLSCVLEYLPKGLVLWRVFDFVPRASLNIAFFIVDNAGFILDANKSFADSLLMSIGDLIGVKVQDICKTAEQVDFFEFLAQNAGSNKARTITFHNIDSTHMQELTLWCSRQNDLIYCIGLNQDQKEDLLIEINQQLPFYHHIFDQAPIGTALVSQDFSVLSFNQAFEELLKKVNVPKKSDKNGVRFLNLFQNDDREQIIATFKKLIDGKIKKDHFEVRFAGSIETVLDLYVTQLSADHHELPYICHLIDKTERKNLEHQFVQSQKMQAVGQLAGGIAHDFNNLLTAMIGFSDLLLLRLSPNDHFFSDVMQIKQNANRAANLVRQLLAFSRQQTLKPRVINLSDNLDELSSLLRRLIGVNISLDIIHERDLGLIKADPGQLDQVVINLVVNARDAMPEGGVVTITTENVHIEKNAQKNNETLVAGDYVVIRVKDTGIGIPKKNLARIFEPFFSTKAVGAGTGLGLSTVYGIVKQTGGYVFVESELHKGTTFSVYLPIHNYQGQIEHQNENGEKNMVDLTGMGAILLVEDEDAVRLFAGRALREKGYQVVEAHSGEAALEIVQREDQKIDLMITDVMMPQMDGAVLLKKVRAIRPKLKVLMISGYSEDVFRQNIPSDDSVQFLAKPFNLKELAGKVKDIFES